MPLRGFDSASESHQSSVSSFRRRPESRSGEGECSAGACPPLGRRWGVAEFALPIRRTKPQLQLCIPWCAGPCRHERLARKCPYAASIVPRNPINLPYRHSGEGRNPEGWGEGSVVRGLVPRWGGGGAWQNPRCQFAVPSHNSGFSYLGVPAPAGMSDCYESVCGTPIRERRSKGSAKHEHVARELVPRLPRR